MAASRCGRPERPAGFHHTLSLVPRIVIAARPIPTARAPVGRRRKSAPSVAVPCDMTGNDVLPLRTAPSRSVDTHRLRVRRPRPRMLACVSELRRLVQQKNGDTVADLEAQTAALTKERRLLFAIFQLPFAPRAR